MFHISDLDIGIERLEFYVPDGFQSVRDYSNNGHEEFSIEKMNSIWTAAFFEPEFQYRFFRDAVSGSNCGFAGLGDGEVQEFTRATGIAGFYSAGDQTASDMAVEVVKRILSRDPAVADRIRVVIHYSSTLNQRLSSCTPARLQHEADLKNSFGFSVGEKNGNASLVALKIATEMLAAEPDLDTILLAGSDKLVPPYKRMFGKLTIAGDSASAMIVHRGTGRRRVLAFKVMDFAEWWNPYHYDERQVNGFNEFAADKSAMLLSRTLADLGACWNDVAMLIPPNMSLSYVRALESRIGIGWDRIYTDNLGRYGYLMSSDMVINLASALDKGMVKNGDIVLLLNVGLALSVGCVILSI